jgi:hypothetical protein
MAGNKQNYVTSQGCSISGLSVGCPVGGSDGWYSDGTYSYYVSSGVVTSVNTDPCYVAAPPPPPPPTTWYSVTLYKRSTSASGACSFGYNSVGAFTYWINASTLDTASAIATASDGSGTPVTGYYADGSSSVYVSGNSVSGFTVCQ